MRNGLKQFRIQNSEFQIPNFLIGLLAFCLLVPAIVMACPACKEALFDPGQLKQTLATAKGYAMSIALLLSVPAALIGGTAALIVRAHRRQRSNVDS